MVKITNQNQSLLEIVICLFKTNAEIITIKPAGNNLKKATISGPPDLTNGAIAAIAVPHNANGRIINNQRQITNMKSNGKLLFKIQITLQKLNDLAF